MIIIFHLLLHKNCRNLPIPAVSFGISPIIAEFPVLKIPT